MEEADKRIETVEDLLAWPAPYNPREPMTDHDFDVLKRSLERHGLVQPIVVNQRTGAQGWPPDEKPVIVGGHQRVRAAADLGWTEMWVEWVDYDEVDERNCNIALNRIVGDWQRDMLERALRELKALGDDLSDTGFTEDEIREWLDAANREPPPEFPDPSEDTNRECPKCGYRYKV